MKSYLVKVGGVQFVIKALDLEHAVRKAMEDMEDHGIRFASTTKFEVEEI